MSFSKKEKRTHRARRNIGLEHLNHLSDEEERYVIERERKRIERMERGEEH